MEQEINFKTYFYNNTDQGKFYSSFLECSKILGCSYMGYIYEDLHSSGRVGFNTNPKWQEEFIGKQLINDCHLWNAVCKYFLNTDSNHFMLPWMCAKPKSSHQKDIILYREDFGIGQNGVSFCTKSSRGREFFFFAPEKNDNAFLDKISKNINFIKQLLVFFRRTSFESISSHKIVKH